MTIERDDYREPFRRWNELSWIRAGEIRGGVLNVAMFSPDLVPLAAHPWLADEPVKQRTLLAYRLITHLHFTTVLELEHVNVACSALAQGRAPIPLDVAKRNDALRIYCDEGGHALFVELLLRQVEEHFGITREVVGRPCFDPVLRRITDEAPVAPELTQLLFVSVSETLVSKILNEMPRDERVCPLVRAVIDDHAQDESRHSTYFQWLFPRLWQSVSPQHAPAVAHMLADFLLAFLGADRGSEQRILSSLGFSEQRAERMLDETYALPAVHDAIVDAAQPTLRMFERAGLFERPETAEAFARRGLTLHGD